MLLGRVGFFLFWFTKRNVIGCVFGQVGIPKEICVPPCASNTCNVNSESAWARERMDWGGWSSSGSQTKIKTSFSLGRATLARRRRRMVEGKCRWQGRHASCHHTDTQKVS